MDVFGDLDGRVQFDAASQAVDALAWIVDVPALEQRLAEAVRYQPLVEVVREPVEAPLTAVCEGRASSTRAEFGVAFSVTPYSQSAIATRLRCERPALGAGDPIDSFAAEITEVVSCVQSGKPSALLDGQLARDALILGQKQTQSLAERRVIEIC